MDNWRRQTGDNNNWGFDDSRRRSIRKKPPRGVTWQPAVPSGVNWQPTVPHWEKRFCKVVGDMDWETLLEKKRFVHVYDNIVKWNDSAGEEAFHNAKKRFLAQLNGWPCEIPLPSPDLYMDKVDWDAKVDLDPLSELEHDEYTVKPEEHHEPVVIFGDALLINLGLSPAGWGDEDQKVKEGVKSSWDNYDQQRLTQIKETSFENDHYNATNPVDMGWDENWLKTEDAAWQQVNNNNYGHQYKPLRESSRFMATGWGDDDDKNEAHGTWQASSNNWENKNTGGYKTRYESSRFTGSNNNHYNKGRYKWRSGSNNGKREAIVN